MLWGQVGKSALKQLFLLIAESCVVVPNHAPIAMSTAQDVSPCGGSVICYTLYCTLYCSLYYSTCVH